MDISTLLPRVCRLLNVCVPCVLVADLSRVFITVERSKKKKKSLFCYQIIKKKNLQNYKNIITKKKSKRISSRASPCRTASIYDNISNRSLPVLQLGFIFGGDGEVQIPQTTPHPWSVTPTNSLLYNYYF